MTGLKESAPNTPQLERISHDFREVSSLFSPLLPSFVESTVRDCIRLGKISPDRSPPLLVTLSRSCDVLGVLSNKSHLADKPQIGIRADLPQSLRTSRSLVLKQRRDLISSEVSPSNIKVGNLSLFVHGKKFGSVVNQEFRLCSDSESSTSHTPLKSPESIPSGSASAELRPIDISTPLVPDQEHS